MKTFQSMLAVAAMVTAAGTAPLAGQQTNGVQVDARITSIDKGAGVIVLESTTIPGHEGSPTELRYAPAHQAALTVYQEGDQVTVGVVTTDGTPRVTMITGSQSGSADLANGPEDSLNRFKVQATITKVDADARALTIETTHIPGHEGGKMTLEYKLTHLAGLTLYKDGDEILADIVVTEGGPQVQSIGSFDPSMVNNVGGGS